MTGGAALIGPPNHRLEVGHASPKHEKSGLEPPVKCWVHTVFIRKSWSCLRHSGKAHTGHQCLRVNLEEPFHHPTGEPALYAEWYAPWAQTATYKGLSSCCLGERGCWQSLETYRPCLEAAVVLPRDSLCQQPPLHFIQTPFSIHRRCPSEQEGAEILRLLGGFLYQELSVVCNGDSYPLSKSHCALASGTPGGPACLCSPALNTLGKPSELTACSAVHLNDTTGVTSAGSSSSRDGHPCHRHPMPSRDNRETSSLGTTFFLPTLQRIWL